MKHFINEMFFVNALNVNGVQRDVFTNALKNILFVLHLRNKVIQV